mmetsp:Transcript_6277/g.18563  ORF Transcript_6277/g.18563 Transcript_6277/m.18563 type:complete len:514 (+) Transcript_6277:41-1582(+)
MRYLWLLACAARGQRPHANFARRVATLDAVGRRTDAVRRERGAPSSHVLSPAAYGADPTGVRDSSDAFDALTTAAWALGGDTPELTNGPDLGVVVDLEGGTYSLSRPWRFPAAGGGNLAVRDGSLVAGPGFPADSDEPLALLMLTAANGTVADDGACCWYEYIYFSNLVLDGGRRTGCARIHTATRVTFDTVFFTGYKTTGLYYGEPSHQLLLTRSFFGATDWRGARENRSLCEDWSHAVRNVGLHLDGPDNHVEDSVFFCSGVGILLNGSANYFEGVHAFTGAVAEDQYPLGALYVPAQNRSGELVGQYGNRFDHCYWDYAMVRVENPLEIEFSNNYVIGLPGRYDANPVPYFQFVALGDDVEVKGLRVSGSTFRAEGANKKAPGGLVAFQLNETSGNFKRDGITNTLVAGNDFTSVRGSTTLVRAKASSITSGEIPSATFDLCDRVLFPPRPNENLTAAHLQSSLEHDRSCEDGKGFLSLTGCNVTITTGSSGQCPFVAYLSLDQSADACF